MKKIAFWINRSKAAYFLLLVPLMLMACDNSLHVVLTNLTKDNISINWQGHHIKNGDAAAVAILTKESPTDSFEICRSYGCLATMTITATEIPEEVNPFEPAGITLYEKTQNLFTFNKLGPITVTLENHEPTFPVSSAEDASDFEMTESDVFFDE
jgi:hypothetical protein